MGELRTEAALITGAARRIGRAIAHDLAGHGWRIAIHYNASAAEAEENARMIRQAGGTAEVFRADLADAGTAARLVEDCAAALGPLTLLVNNASLYEKDDIHTLTPQAWAAHLDINLRAPVLLAQAFARALPDGDDGVIVNMIDQRVWNLSPEFFSYTVSKAGLWAVTRMLAQALAPRIRVNGIGPGPTFPNEFQSKADFEREKQTTLLKRSVSAQEICAAVRFILATPSMTGQMIALDAGQHLSRAGASRGPGAPE